MNMTFLIVLMNLMLQIVQTMFAFMGLVGMDVGTMGMDVWG